MAVVIRPSIKSWMTQGISAGYTGTFEDVDLTPVLALAQVIKRIYHNLSRVKRWSSIWPCLLNICAQCNQLIYTRSIWPTSVKSANFNGKVLQVALDSFRKYCEREMVLINYREKKWSNSSLRGKGWHFISNFTGLISHLTTTFANDLSPQ